MGVYIAIFLIVFLFLFRKPSGAGNQKPGALSWKNDPLTVYATVYIYNGDYSTACYKVKKWEKYEEKEIVLVDRMGELYAGRILDLCYGRPEDLPKDVRVKDILGHFRPGDEKKVAFWNEEIQKTVYNTVYS